MFKNLTFIKTISIIGILFIMMAIHTPLVAHANDPVKNLDNGYCVSCHEDLYYLHDTGKWFCLNESPMTCTDCHGGNPDTLDKELAHAQRAAHPIVNDDVTKCQQCHPAECYDRVELFEQAAGISEVLVAAPYTSSYSTEYTDFTLVNEDQKESGNVFIYWELIPLTMVSGSALTIYLVIRRRHR